MVLWEVMIVTDNWKKRKKPSKALDFAFVIFFLFRLWPASLTGSRGSDFLHPILRVDNTPNRLIPRHSAQARLHEIVSQTRIHV